MSQNQEIEKILSRYSKYSLEVIPKDLFLTTTRAEGKIILQGKNSEDLWSVKRQLLSQLNSFFFENPFQLDDETIFLEVIEKNSEYDLEKNKLTIFLLIEPYSNKECFCV
jgi:hypothetical protein